MTDKPTSNNVLRTDWHTYEQNIVKILSDIQHLNTEIECAQLHVDLEEQAIVKHPIQSTSKEENKNHILHAARKISARGQRRLDRLQKRVDGWERNEISPRTKLIEMHDRSLMDILKEIRESLEDEMVEVAKIINAEERVVKA